MDYSDAVLVILELSTEMYWFRSCTPNAGVLKAGSAVLLEVPHHSVRRVELHRDYVTRLETHCSLFLVLLLHRVTVYIPRLVQHVHSF